MDYRVIFSPVSIRDLADSISYIARHDAEAAIRIGDGLIDAAERQLVAQPRIGPDCLARCLQDR
jgi:plasmid stabilization system protein ParE